MTPAVPAAPGLSPDDTDSSPLAEVVAIHDAAERLAQAWSKSYESVADQVSAPQLRALLVVAAMGPLTMTRLGGELGAMVSSVSRLCDRLVAAGFLEREHSPRSRREVLVRLTPGGEELLTRVRSRRVADLAAVLARMAEPDRRALLAGLSAYAAVAGEPPPVPRPRA